MTPSLALSFRCIGFLVHPVVPTSAGGGREAPARVSPAQSRVVQNGPLLGAQYVRLVIFGFGVHVSLLRPHRIDPQLETFVGNDAVTRLSPMFDESFQFLLEGRVDPFRIEFLTMHHRQQHVDTGTIQIGKEPLLRSTLVGGGSNARGPLLLVPFEDAVVRPGDAYENAQFVRFGGTLGFHQVQNAAVPVVRFERTQPTETGEPADRFLIVVPSVRVRTRAGIARSRPAEPDLVHPIELIGIQRRTGIDATGHLVRSPQCPGHVEPRSHLRMWMIAVSGQFAKFSQRFDLGFGRRRRRESQIVP
mmetsp:Transcript_23352/g.69031  ORF Transcript_23352/g.69031 Transcript_23352/m.69031 type:complete len:304 (-) Transcript_23352:979-1890(-)